MGRDGKAKGTCLLIPRTLLTDHLWILNSITDIVAQRGVQYTMVIVLSKTGQSEGQIILPFPYPYNPVLLYPLYQFYDVSTILWSPYSNASHWTDVPAQSSYGSSLCLTITMYKWTEWSASICQVSWTTLAETTDYSLQIPGFNSHRCGIMSPSDWKHSATYILSLEKCSGGLLVSDLPQSARSGGISFIY